MSDLAPLLTPQSPLPGHLYGTRAALFHLLRDAPHPAGTARPAPLPPPSPVALPATVVRMLPAPPAPARPSIRDLLHSDSFDFRGLGEGG